MADDSSIATYFADMALRLLSVDTVDDTLTIIVHSALEIIDGCDHVSVSHLQGKELRSRASNDEIGPLLDAIQTETQEGPCLDAIRDGTVYASDFLGDDPRWPEYGPRAVEATKVLSSMATELNAGGRIIGALNLFSEERGAFGDRFDQQATVAILAAHATAVHLHNSLTHILAHLPDLD